SEMGMDPDIETPTLHHYVYWFAARLGEQMAVLRRARCVFDYRRARDPGISCALHESQISLLAELHDLDTAMMTDQHNLDGVLLMNSQAQRLTTEFLEFHRVECQHALRIVLSLARIAFGNRAASVRRAVEVFWRGY